MAGRTIDIHAGRNLRGRGVPGVAGGGNRRGFVLVLVMTEMCRGERAFVLAIRRRECPGRLEHYEECEENAQQGTHGGARIALAP